MLAIPASSSSVTSTWPFGNVTMFDVTGFATSLINSTFVVLLSVYTSFTSVVPGDAANTWSIVVAPTSSNPNS